MEKEMATHSSILAWEIPWTEEPGGLQSMGLQRVGHGRETEQIQQHTCSKCITYSVIKTEYTHLINLQMISRIPKHHHKIPLMQCLIFPPMKLLTILILNSID